jgi:type IV pilus assembly protein PilO
MAKSSPISFEFSSLFDQAAGQFRNLDTRDPGQWPVLPRAAAWLGVVAIVVFAGYMALLKSAHETLDEERGREPRLREDYRSRLAMASNLAELRKQKLQVQEHVTQLEKQLPGKADIDALLSDINQAGLGRGLQFELFRPGQLQVRDYYAELPIAIRVSGRYHDIGSFAADVANLSRIVTLHNLTLTPPREAGGVIAMDATARTYRYLEKAESDAQQKAQAAAKGERK